MAGQAIARRVDVDASTLGNGRVDCLGPNLCEAILK